jgi:hypothetical protein
MYPNSVHWEVQGMDLHVSWLCLRQVGPCAVGPSSAESAIPEPLTLRQRALRGQAAVQLRASEDVLGAVK